LGTGGREDLPSANCAFEYDTTALAFDAASGAGQAGGVRVAAAEAVRGRVSVALYSADPISPEAGLLGISFRLKRYPIPPAAIEWTSLELNENPARGGRTVIYGLDLSIQGRVRYASSGAPVSGVRVEARGPAADTVRTDGAGFYQLAPLPYGVSDLEVRPFKPVLEDVGPATVTALDASEVMRHLSGEALPAERQAAADADGNGLIEPADAAAIAAWTVGAIPDGTAPVGRWRFIPEFRIYPELHRSFHDEDYTAVVIGDADGNWNRSADSLNASGLFPDTLTADTGDVFLEAALSAPAGFAFRSACMEVRYDTTAVSFIEAKKPDTLDALTLAFWESPRGTVRAALFAAEAVERHGPFAALRFELKPGGPERFNIGWTGMAFDDRPAAGGITAVRIVRPDTASHDTSAVPRTRGNGPSDFGLSGVYPNPFNPSVTVEYGLDRPEEVSIRVLDVYGRETAVLFEGRENAGRFRVQWDGRSASGMDAPSGLYVIRMTAGDRTSGKKVIKIR
ncbi:MAG: carboxypeptidase regulatory-like domain-containing protein, partial [bacterium]|nr:carboxypeptidase regulatory-like domain-containing protein [bacterium]